MLAAWPVTRASTASERARWEPRLSSATWNRHDNGAYAAHHLAGFSAVSRMNRIPASLPGCELRRIFLSFPHRCVAGTHGSSDRRRGMPWAGQGRQFPRRNFQILADVVAQGFGGRDVEDLRLAIGFPRRAAHQAVETNQKAASVLPEPVGAEMRTSRGANFRPALRPRLGGAVKRWANHSAMRIEAGERHDSIYPV